MIIDNLQLRRYVISVEPVETFLTYMPWRPSQAALSSSSSKIICMSTAQEVLSGLREVVGIQPDGDLRHSHAMPSGWQGLAASPGQILRKIVFGPTCRLVIFLSKHHFIRGIDFGECPGYPDLSKAIVTEIRAMTR